MVASSCRRTLVTLIQVCIVNIMMVMMMMMMMMIISTDAQNAMENVENKILEVLEDVGEKMAPVIKVVMRKMMIIITMNFLPQKIMFQTCTLTAGGLETKLMHDAYISFIHLWKFFTLAQNWRDIVFKNIDQDFLLKTTNLMTYAARDKNSLLNFLDENLVIAFHLRLFQMTFSGAFERQPDRRQFPTDPCRHLGELGTGGQYKISSLLSVFSDPGGDDLPVHREQEAPDLLQDPPRNPQSPLRLLLWRPHAKGRNSHQVEKNTHIGLMSSDSYPC